MHKVCFIEGNAVSNAMGQEWCNFFGIGNADDPVQNALGYFFAYT